MTPAKRKKAKRIADLSATFDEIDWRALEELQEDGRISLSDLSEALELSRAAVSERVKRLEEAQVIREYTAVLSPRAVGLGVMAFIGVVMEHPRYRDQFLELVDDVPEILECHHVTGTFDYLLKVRCKDTDALEDLSTQTLKGIRALARTTTMISLSSEKETTHVPLSRNPLR